MCWPLSPWEGVCRFAANTCSWKGRKCTWFQLVGPSAVAMACTLPLESEIEAAAGTCSHPPWRSCGQCPATWEGTQKKKLLWQSSPSPHAPLSMASCFSSRPRLLPTPSVVAHHTQPSQAISLQPTPVLTPGLTSKAQASAPSCHPH